MDSRFAPLILIDRGSVRALRPLSFQNSSVEGSYDERAIQDLMFKHPEAIPVSEIDASFAPLIPICVELDTREAGIVDALYANHLGMLTIAEFKLWRNPEARRKVVAQILDYARVLSRWSYADLQREVSRALRQQGRNALYEIVKAKYPDCDEASFIDAVSRNLRQGRFLLLVVGDGIREGVEAIAEYIQAHAGLHFTFGLVEVGIYELGPNQRIVQPRILARTLIVNRSVVELIGPDLQLREQGEQEEPDEELNDRQAAIRGFWVELLDGLHLDDTDQSLARPTLVGNIFFYMPTKDIWITAYTSQREKGIGVFLGWLKTSSLASEIISRLEADRDQIERELEIPVSWEYADGKLRIVARRSCRSLSDPVEREKALAWLRATINIYVNVFRPRIAALLKEIAVTSA